MAVQREKQLQSAIVKFVKNCVTVPHLLLAFDRSENRRSASGDSHMWEAARGIKTGTPDTVLLVGGMPSLWVELKAGNKGPTDAQLHVHALIRAASHKVTWCNSVEGYRKAMLVAGVPLIPAAAIVAADYDAKLAVRFAAVPKPRPSSAARVGGKPGKRALGLGARALKRGTVLV